jgi:hypothetical protein
MSDYGAGSASATADMGGGVSADAGASLGLSGMSAGAEIDFGEAGSLGVSIDSNLKIIEMLMPINLVSFDYNPKDFKVTRTQRQNSRGRSGGGGGGVGGPPPAAQPSYLGAHPLQIDFTALLSDEQGGAIDAVADATAIGGGIKARCDMLLNWCVGGPSTLLGMIVGMAANALGIGVQTSMRPPLLILQWGDPARGFLLRGTMQKVTVNYLRFDPLGNPTRAAVTCTFQEAQSNLLSLLTNPTSGGVSGGRMHTMTQGENLQNVATERYGRPGAWRQVAEANGIDDPQRVRPGHVLSLPPPQEIRG